MSAPGIKLKAEHVVDSKWHCTVATIYGRDEEEGFVCYLNGACL